MYSTEEVKENYKSLSDSKIVSLAQNESKSLRKEILSILKDEIEVRNLDKNLINWVDAETNSFAGLERKDLINKIQNLNCPKCNKTADKLRGFEINTITSFLIFSNYSRKEKILCNGCGKKEKLYALLITFFAGWWSRQGIFQTPWVIIKDSVNFIFLEKISNRIFDRVINDNTGYLRLKGTEQKTLSNLIKKINGKEVLEDDGFDFD